MITYGPTLGLSNNIMMILRRVMRYNGLDLSYFAENLILVERLISAELLDKGSFIKFLFQFGDNWYFIKRVTTDQKQFTIEMLNSDGIWDFSDIFNVEGNLNIYVKLKYSLTSTYGRISILLMIRLEKLLCQPWIVLKL